MTSFREEITRIKRQYPPEEEDASRLKFNEGKVLRLIFFLKKIKYYNRYTYFIIFLKKKEFKNGTVSEFSCLSLSEVAILLEQTKLGNPENHGA